MKNTNTRSQHREAAGVHNDFDQNELRHCRMLLRRLRFLETKMLESDGLGDDPTGSAAFVGLEHDALAWVLTDIGFLDSANNEK